MNRDRVFLKFLFNPAVADITDEDVEYFREHPDEIDEFTAPLNIHKVFLLLGAFLGTIFVAVSKVIKYSDLFDILPEILDEFLVDIVFEIGVALIGAAVTAYILGVLLNQQQKNAAKWRAEIWRRIRSKEG